jgi:hypothetical protein
VSSAVQEARARDEGSGRGVLSLRSFDHSVRSIVPLTRNASETLVTFAPSAFGPYALRPKPSTNQTNPTNRTNVTNSTEPTSWCHAPPALGPMLCALPVLRLSKDAPCLTPCLRRLPGLALPPGNRRLSVGEFIRFFSNLPGLSDLPVTWFRGRRGCASWSEGNFSR